MYNIFKFNLSLQSSTFCYFIIIIITIHLYSLLVFVINIVVLCLVSSHAQSADLMSIIITRQFSVIAVIIGHTLDVLLLPDYNTVLCLNQAMTGTVQHVWLVFSI